VVDKKVVLILLVYIDLQTGVVFFLILDQKYDLSGNDQSIGVFNVVILSLVIG
jgi:hypothetical protein